MPPRVRRLGDRVNPCGVHIIEPRIWIGYGLIILMVAAIALATAYFRYNSPQQKARRSELRERERYQERFPG